MSKKILGVLLSFAKKIFFDLSPKFRTGSLKYFVDHTYVYLEKIAFKFDFLASYYIDLYDEIVEKEVSMADISENDYVLVIGCGSLPATSILIKRKTNARTVSIDIDPNAVKNALVFLQSHKPPINIELEEANGLFYKLEQFDVIFLLYGIKQQNEMLDTISNKMKGTSRVVFRSSEDMVNQTFGGLDFLKEKFTVDQKVTSDSMTSLVSYLLLKK
jgi:precorrin-6B methylase 2